MTEGVESIATELVKALARLEASFNSRAASLRTDVHVARATARLAFADLPSPGLSFAGSVEVTSTDESDRGWIWEIRWSASTIIPGRLSELSRRTEVTGASKKTLT